MTSSEQHNSNPEHDRDRGACPAPEELSAYFDGALDSEAASSVKRHLAACDACRADLHDFSIIRSAVRATSPNVSTRSFAVLEPAPVNRSGTIPREADRRRPFPRYPAFAAIAAVLIIALIAGELLTGDGGSPPRSPDSADEILMIDGTPYGPDANDAEFGAASADDMNEGKPGESTVGEQEPGDGFLNGWRIAQILALAGMAIAGGLWYSERRRDRPKTQS